MTATTPHQEALQERRQLHHEADVVVVGAGVFGCAIAVALARQGRSVILLERWLKEPDRIVGELLQPGGVSALKKLGLADCLEGIDAVTVKGYDVIYYGQEVMIPYPCDGTAAAKSAEGARPEGFSFHHGRFIRKLREACAREPNISIFETTVKSTIRTDYSSQVLGVVTETADAATGEKKADYFFSALTIVADGYASTFRKQYITKTPIVKSKFYALELIDCPLPAPNYGHVLLGDSAPVLLYQIGTHETRALFDIPEGLPTATAAAGGVKAHIANVVIPSLPERTRASVATALATGKLRSMPNSFLPPSAQQTPGVVILGDAMNMRHPLTGGGMTVAFNDVVILASLLDPSKVPDLSDTLAVRQAMRSFHWERKNLGSIINILSMALYALFAANDSQLKALQRGCFEYFQLGGVCKDGPVGLLAGIIKRPIVLVGHFYAVAMLAIWLVVKETVGGILGLWKLPIAVGLGMGVLWKACVVIMPYIFSELRW